LSSFAEGGGPAFAFALAFRSCCCFSCHLSATWEDLAAEHLPPYPPPLSNLVIPSPEAENPLSFSLLLPFTVALLLLVTVAVAFAF
jgi:hypothetical protein